MLVIIAAVLALAGAPAGTQVSCGSVPRGEVGWAWWNVSPPRIILGPVSCGALLYAGATDQERAEIRTLNGLSVLDASETEGVGLLVALHEASHAAGLHDETAAECAAVRLLPVLLDRLGVTGYALWSALDAARGWDYGLPSVYREGCS
jgi:hypothetical protein